MLPRAKDYILITVNNNRFVIKIQDVKNFALFASIYKKGELNILVSNLFEYEQPIRDIILWGKTELLKPQLQNFAF